MNREKLLIGICGSVGATVVINYIYELSNFFDIEIILTRNALEFVQPNGFASLVNNYYVEEFVKGKTLHIELAESSTKMLILPASANVISKMAHGIADDLLTSTLLAYEKPVYIAANMNPKMWKNSILQDNVHYLKSKGHIFVNEGRMAIETASGKEIYSEACMPSVDRLITILRES